MSKAKPNPKTLDRVRSGAVRGRGWLKALAPEELATLHAIRAEHQGPNGPLNLTATLAILQEDFGKRIASMKTFGDWMRTPPAREQKAVRGFSREEDA